MKKSKHIELVVHKYSKQYTSRISVIFLWQSHAVCKSTAQRKIDFSATKNKTTTKKEKN